MIPIQKKDVKCAQQISYIPVRQKKILYIFNYETIIIKNNRIRKTYVKF